MSREILIIGAGEMGVALAHVLSQDKENHIELWDKNPLQYSQKNDVRNLLANAGSVFICVPSVGLGEALDMIKKYVKEDSFVICMTKGIEPNSKKFPGEIMVDMLGEHRSGILAGPTLSSELEKDLPATAVLAGSGYMFENVSKLFEESTLRLDYSEDILGISILSVLKNIYSIILGAVQSIDMGANVVGDLVTLMIHEMMEITDGFGGDMDSTLTHAGLGDLVATGISEDSTNHQLGAAFAKGEEPKKYSEGYTSLPILIEKMGDVEIPPVLLVAKKFVVDREPLSEALSEII